MTTLTPAERDELMAKAYEDSKRVHEEARRKGVEYVARKYAPRSYASPAPAPAPSVELTATDKAVVSEAMEILADTREKITDDDVYANPLFVEAAQLYLSTYTGNFEFLVSMKTDSQFYGFAKWTAGKYRGVLNCMRAEAQRKAREAKVVSAPISINSEPATGSVEAPSAVPVPLGTYTAVLEDRSHVTIRVKKHWLPEEAKKGTTVVQFLSGSDNETAYTGFAFQNGNHLLVWKKFANGAERLKEAWAIISRDPAEAGAGYAMHSGNCFRCGRTLTVPLSLHRGLGPECFSKWGS